jgi:hypothetical protein
VVTQPRRDSCITHVEAIQEAGVASNLHEVSRQLAVLLPGEIGRDPQRGRVAIIVPILIISVDLEARARDSRASSDGTVMSRRELMDERVRGFEDRRERSGRRVLHSTLRPTPAL